MSDLAAERTTQAAPVKAVPKPRLKWIAFAGLAGCLALGAARYGYDWWTVGRFIESTDDAYVGGDVTPISPHVAGFVAQILVADNDYVRAGQLLVWLDDRDFRAAVERAMAVVGERQAALASLQARDLLQQSTIRQAKADLDARTAEATFAREDDLRYRELAQSSAGSRQNAKRRLRRTKRLSPPSSRPRRPWTPQSSSSPYWPRKSPKLAPPLTRRRRIFRPQPSISATRKSARPSTATSAIAPQRSALTSPAAPISSPSFRRISSGSTPISRRTSSQISPGEPATVVADTLPDHVFHGRVLSLAPGTGAIFSVIPPENATGNFTKIVQRVPVRVALDPDDPKLGALRPGLSVTASVDIRSGSGRMQ